MLRRNPLTDRELNYLSAPFYVPYLILSKKGWYNFLSLPYWVGANIANKSIDYDAKSDTFTYNNIQFPTNIVLILLNDDVSNISFAAYTLEDFYAQFTVRNSTTLSSN